MQSQIVTIIGGGPAGLTCGIYCARAGLKPLIVARSGGQLEITTEIENFPGVADGTTGPQLVQRMQEQATHFGANIVTTASVKSISSHDRESFSIVLDDGQHFTSQLVVIAVGATARWLGIPGEQQLQNKGVSACATCDGPLPYFRNQTLAVVGGGDTAMEEALFLTKFASNVVIIHRGKQFRASKVMIERVMAHPKIQVMWNTVVTSCNGVDRLESLSLANTNSVATTAIPDLVVRGLFVAIGHDPSTRAIQLPHELKVDDHGYIATTNNIFTSVPNLLTAGDCHDNRYRQAITAAGFGCMAALECEKIISSQIKE